MNAPFEPALIVISAPATDPGVAVQVDPRDDATLAVLAIHEDEAFAELYRRYAGAVYRYLLSRTGSPQDAEDLTQHVFSAALAALPRYQSRPGLPFRAWLLTMARNAAVDVYRRQRRVFPWDHVARDALAIEERTPESITIRRENANELRIAIAKLDPEKQELLALRFAARLPFVEIARIMGKNPEAVKKQAQRVLQSLKEKMDER